MTTIRTDALGLYFILQDTIIRPFFGSKMELKAGDKVHSYNKKGTGLVKIWINDPDQFEYWHISISKRDYMPENFTPNKYEILLGKSATHDEFLKKSHEWHKEQAISNHTNINHNNKRP